MKIALCTASAAVVLSALTAGAQCGPSGCVIERAPAVGPISRGEMVAPSHDDAIARVVCRGPGGASLGTATLVATTGEASYFVTCGHVFDDPGQVSIVLQGASAPGRVVGIDRPHDVALVETRPMAGKPVEVADLARGDVLTACGFGSTGELRCVRGPVTGFSTAAGASQPSLRLRGAVRPGDSGGPVLNAAGRLVAVVWGERDGETYAMGGAPLRRLLERLPRSLPRQTPSTSPFSDPPASQPATESLRAEQAWRNRIEKQLQQLAADSRQAPPTIPDDLARRGDLKALATEWDRRWASEPAAAPAPRPRATLFTTLAEWFFVEPLVASVAVGGPLGFALWAVAGWFRRSANPKHHTETTRSIAIDTPPPPQRVVPETHFVSYERDDFARAHQWATEQLARKFPGSVELLSSLDSLIRQQLNGGAGR